MELVVPGESIILLGDTEKSTQSKRIYTNQDFSRLERSSSDRSCRQVDLLFNAEI